MPETEQAFRKYSRKGRKEVRKERANRERMFISGRPDLGPVGGPQPGERLICLLSITFLLVLMPGNLSFEDLPSHLAAHPKVLPLLSRSRLVTQARQLTIAQNPNLEDRHSGRGV